MSAGDPVLQERFVEEVRGDDHALASYLRIEERELEGIGRTRG